MRLKYLGFFFAFTLVFLFNFSPVIFYSPGSRTFGYFGDKVGLIYRMETGGAVLLTQPVLGFFLSLLSKFLSPLATYNFIVLLSFPLACFFAYKFFRRFFNSLLAFVLGTIFTFSPYHIYKIYNHTALSQIWVFPLCFSALLDFDEEVSLKSTLKLAGTFALTTLISNYYGYFLLFTTACLFIFRAIQSHFSAKPYFTRDHLKSYLLLVTCYLLLTLPFLFPYIRANYLGEPLTSPSGWPLKSERGTTDFVAFSARAWYFVVPPVDHPVFGRAAQGIHDWFSSTGYFLFDDFFWEEHSAIFLGWTNLALAAYAVYNLLKAQQKKKTKYKIPNTKYDYVRIFFWLAVIQAIFSGPPIITIADMKLALPSYILMKLFPMFRTLSRLGLPILLCVLVLSGYGLEALRRRFKWSSSKYLILTTLYLLLTLFEFYFPPEVRSVSNEDLMKMEILRRDSTIREVNIIKE